MPPPGGNGPGGKEPIGRATLRALLGRRITNVKGKKAGAFASSKYDTQSADWLSKPCTRLLHREREAGDAVRGVTAAALRSSLRVLALGASAQGRRGSREW